MISVGIIGFGRIGAEHAAWLERSEGIRAVAAFDPTPQRRALAESRGLRAVDSIAGIYGDPSIQAILISTPTAMHFDHAFLALMNKRHVMIEKPMALSRQEAEQLIAASNKSGTVLSVFHNRRWDIDFLTVCQAIESNLFGRVINIESRISQWSSCVGPAAREWNPNWRNQSQFGGGGLYDWGSHLIDQLWQLMLPARPVRVFAQLRGNIWSSDCDDFARVCIDFDNGAVGLVEINTTTTRPLPRWHIDGAAGSVEGPSSLTYNTQEWARLHFKDSANATTMDLPLAETGLSESEIWTQFGKAVLGDAAPAVTVQSVIPTMVLLDAARQSSSTGSAIEIPPTIFKRI